MAEREPNSSSLWLFVIKFLVFICVIVGLWWELLMPAYGWLLAKTCAFIGNLFLGLDISASRTITKGLFNVESMIEFTMGAKKPAITYSLLVTNLCPYLALVLATPNIELWKRLRILAYGITILVVGHVLYLCVLLRFQESLQQHSQIPIAVTQVFLTLPFLLWIVFAYWPRVVALTNEKH